MYGSNGACCTYYFQYRITCNETKKNEIIIRGTSNVDDAETTNYRRGKVNRRAGTACSKEDEKN